MSSPNFKKPVSRARKTCHNKFSAAAIAVICAVNPDTPGAFLFLITAWLLTSFSFAFPIQARTAMNNAIYNNLVIDVTPMLFHHIEVGMNYDGVLNAVGKSATFCDSGEGSCSADNGYISKSCLNNHFINTNHAWVCHWDGAKGNNYVSSHLEVWFMGDLVSRVAAITPDGLVYKRDSNNTVYLEKDGVRS